MLCNYCGKELEVPTFCDLHIDLPYNVRVKPLNVHKYHNCDKLILQIDKRCEGSLDYDLYGNRVTIVDKIKNEDNDILCSIKAPLKSNLYIKSQKDIAVGYFHGDHLCLESTQGNISVDKFQGNTVELTTNVGNINIKDFIQASEIYATVLESGDINSGRLQSLNLRVSTNHGNISVESCYAYESHFDIIKGNLDLNNAHKSCKVFIKDGNINIAGFDGKLITVLDKGSANIQLSRITENSEINIMDGTLHLKLADACQDYVQYKLKTKDWNAADNVRLSAVNCDGTVVLTPDINEENTVVINCLNGSVQIDSASWKDMMTLKIKK